jgi:hypothetical protein
MSSDPRPQTQDIGEDFQELILRWGRIQTAPNEAFSTTPIAPRCCIRAPLAQLDQLSAGMADEWGDRDAECRMPGPHAEKSNAG